jgi:NodT family efflux transporter outer membrane factor (OMF) lipoprotein
VLLAVALMSACATSPPQLEPIMPAPRHWNAPLPHGGDAEAVREWWSRFDDPLLPELVQAAEATSPTLAQAVARIRQARAAVVQARAAGLPVVSGIASVQRSKSLQFGTQTTGTAGVDASWESDLFGGVRHSTAAAAARAEASSLQWHDARVTLAAEVGQSYARLRACEALAAVYEQEAQSQARTAELTRERIRVGFEAPASGSLADAGAADSASRWSAQRAECAVALQGLVLLTGLPTDALASRLQSRTAQIPQPPRLRVDEVPAQVLTQRPDVAAAQRILAAAASDISAAEAQRFPVLSLAGSVALAAARAVSLAVDSLTWSLGPAFSVPLVDGGRRAAAVDAARGRYDEARAGFEQSARAAVREVEEALIRLDSARNREADAERAARGYREYFAAAESRWQVGSGNLLDMEEARRLALAADAGLIAVQSERVTAWISLYKAVGGGWEMGLAGPASTR